jgi:hypothetical protein
MILKQNKRMILIGIIVGIGLLSVVVLANWRSIGTRLANPMRQLLGKERVSQLETFVFEIQDQVKQWKYDLGLEKPDAPAWAVVATPLPSATPLPPTATLPPTQAVATATPGGATPTGSTPTPVPATATITPMPTPTYWTLPNLAPFGDLAGEGIWQPYLYDASGEVVGLRTFLQPDPERPYAVVAVVAVDLTRTKLTYVLGLKEPAMPESKHGLGIIPIEDRQPVKLLAAFNGGFIAEHGYYGAMADGLVTLGAKTGLATLAIYKDGGVRLGEWGTDLTESRDYQSYRQNALMVVHNGVINDKVYNSSYLDWGANLDGAIVTIRSGAGLSQDNNVLFYFAGPSLSMPVLADAMLRAGAYNSMLLDINPTHAHFAAMKVVDGKLTSEALFPEIMDLWVDRYLAQWEMDFFYITGKE